MKVLKRRPNSGFVMFPKEFEKRILDGTARHRTKCDLLVGPCACGAIHREHDSYTRAALSDYDMSIEPLVLKELDGVVVMPRYWEKPSLRNYCDVLLGPCACGRTHSVTEAWVKDILRRYNAVIEGVPQDSGEVLLGPFTPATRHRFRTLGELVEYDSDPIEDPCPTPVIDESSGLRSTEPRLLPGAVEAYMRSWATPEPQRVFAVSPDASFYEWRVCDNDARGYVYQAGSRRRTIGDQ